MANWILVTTMTVLFWVLQRRKGAKICLLLQRLRAVSWCLMRIIHSGLVQGWGGPVFHIVKSLVVSAHIMKWDCHPAMRPLRSQKQTLRTCCWCNTERRTRESLKRLRPVRIQEEKVGKTSWVQERLKKTRQHFISLCCNGKIRDNHNQCDKRHQNVLIALRADLYIMQNGTYNSEWGILLSILLSFMVFYLMLTIFLITKLNLQSD